MRKTIVALLFGMLLLVVTAAGVFLMVSRKNSTLSSVSSFEECLAAGNTIMESYPPQCRTPDGRVFIQDIGNELEKIEWIMLHYPRPNQAISSPLVIEGEARGPWFFEADFPVFLQNGDGEVIGTAIAQAQGEWMTEEFVPFQAVLEFEAPAGERLWLILEKDNPSGLPENADALRVPVWVAK